MKYVHSARITARLPHYVVREDAGQCWEKWNMERPKENIIMEAMEAMKAMKATEAMEDMAAMENMQDIADEDLMKIVCPD